MTEKLKQYNEKIPTSPLQKEINKLKSKIDKQKKIITKQIANYLIIKEKSKKNITEDDIIKQEILKRIISKNIKQLSFYIQEFRKLISKKYIGETFFTREKVNSINTLKKIFWAKDRKEISNKDIKDILETLYYQAFKNEIKHGIGKKGIENIRKHEKNWKKIFDKNLKTVIKNKKLREDLFLLSWIESNGIATAKSGKNAQGYFQILPETAKKYGMDNNNGLNDPIKSAEIASKYLHDLIEEIKKENPLLNNENKIIELAIQRYNGNWTRRLKEHYQKHPLQSIYLISKELNFLLKKGNLLTNEQLINKIKYIQNKFFTPGRNHLGILDKENPNKKEILDWLKRYINIIIKQQLMYPYQFNAIKKLYYDTKKQ